MWKKGIIFILLLFLSLEFLSAAEQRGSMSAEQKLENIVPLFHQQMSELVTLRSNLKIVNEEKNFLQKNLNDQTTLLNRLQTSLSTAQNISKESAKALTNALTEWTALTASIRTLTTSLTVETNLNKMFRLILCIVLPIVAILSIGIGIICCYFVVKYLDNIGLIRL